MTELKAATRLRSAAAYDKDDIERQVQRTLLKFGVRNINPRWRNNDLMIPLGDTHIDNDPLCDALTQISNDNDKSLGFKICPCARF